MADEVRALLNTPMRSYKEWELFDAKVTSLVERGMLRRIDPLRCIHLRHEEWYLEPSSGDLYVYVKPDDKIYPSWEIIDPFSPPKPRSMNNMVETGLQLISNEGLRRETLSGYKSLLNLLVDQREIEGVTVPPLDEVPPGFHETWYRERSSGHLYRLIENPTYDEYRWERVSQEEFRIRSGTANIN